MKYMKYAVPIFMLLFLPALTPAQVTTSTYKDACLHFTDGADLLSKGLCAGYTAGWLDGINGSEITIKGQAYSIGFAPGVTTNQIILVTMKYIEQHPESLNKPIAETLVEALLSSKLMGLTPVEREPARDVQ